MKSISTFQWFIRIAVAEGLSFLVLLLIAMPLKYMAGYPMPVTIIGAIHGILFIAFLVLAWDVKREHKKDWGWLAKAFLASILPLGTLVMHKYWKREAIA